MNPQLRKVIEPLGADLNPQMMQGTQAIFAESFAGMDPATQIEHDIAYGPHERHRLDIYRRQNTRGGPVLVYVHGGGFVMGGKTSPDRPFFGNVGDFAARSGMVGVTVNYRLAPQNPWPAGPEDMARIVGWLRDNIAEHGGDPSQIYLMGQSAGAVHVASYVAHPRFHAVPGGGIAGALLISCIYDVAAAEVNQFHIAYYSEDTTAWTACSSLDGLIDSDIPLLATVSEFDVGDFQRQAAAFVAAYTERRGQYPRMQWLSGHNHLSPALEIGSADSTLEAVITDFISAHSSEE